MTELRVPALSLILLVGVSGAGKSTVAAKHFTPTQVISSDFCRGLVADDFTDQSATTDAFDVLQYIVNTRLRRGMLTVVDATNVQPEARAQLIKIAKANHVLVDAVVLEVDETVARQRNADRADRDFGAHVVRRQHRELRRGMRRIRKEGFRRVHVVSPTEVDDISFGYDRAWSDKTELTGPFDIIGDVHGCRAELETLLGELGWRLERDDTGAAIAASHPHGRTAVFVGDLVDRGPDTPGVLRLVMNMVEAGTALCVAGNHEDKLARALAGRKVKVAHGLAESMAQLETAGAEFTARAREFTASLISHYQFDGGKLVVAHAGLKESHHGRASGAVRAFALYGDTTGETDEYGLPVRYPWAKEYRGKATVVYGHTPVPQAEWVNNTICLDTGCVFGGHLTALRYPERELVDTAATTVHYEPVRPMQPTETRDPGVLDHTDVGGTRHIETGLHGRVKIREENSAAALEIVSRFTIDPRWLLYLPPTMAPGATSTVDGMLEHPAEAFAEYHSAGVQDLVCQEKHMGSRAVALVCRNPSTAAERFGVDGRGVIYTRTGRAFFPDSARTEALLDRVRQAATDTGLWDTLDSDWFLLDCELLPWSAKAGGLIREQFAPVATAARDSLITADQALRAAAARGLDVTALVERNETRRGHAEAFRVAYGRYCWPTEGLEGIRLAPFQILAAQGANLARRGHDWHLPQLAALAAADSTGTIATTGRVYVDTNDPASTAQATQWWSTLTAAGGEGMVVKPRQGLVCDAKGRPRQPGMKVRGPEYLRIVYGADYTDADNLRRLRQRKLGHKRSLASREYALGMEALDRLAKDEPLWRIHEPVFGVLALESDPVDPRL